LWRKIKFFMEEKMKKRNVLVLGILAIVLVFGMMVTGCASYMEWYYSTLPGGKEQHDRQMAEINERNRNQGSSSSGSSSSSGGSSSGGSSSSSGGSSSGGSSSSSGGSSSGVQQPSNTDATITRTYSFNVPTSGQAGGGAAAVAKAEAEANATERFRRENPGYEIRNIQSQFDGFGTLTVTITGRKSN
jgi:hypothetical protein